MEKTHHLLRFRLVGLIENRPVVRPTVLVFGFSLESVIIFHSPGLYGDKGQNRIYTTEYMNVILRSRVRRDTSVTFSSWRTYSIAILCYYDQAQFPFCG